MVEIRLIQDLSRKAPVNQKLKLCSKSLGEHRYQFGNKFPKGKSNSNQFNYFSTNSQVGKHNRGSNGSSPISSNSSEPDLINSIWSKTSSDYTKPSSVEEINSVEQDNSEPKVANKTIQWAFIRAFYSARKLQQNFSRKQLTDLISIVSNGMLNIFLIFGTEILSFSKPSFLILANFVVLYCLNSLRKNGTVFCQDSIKESILQNKPPENELQNLIPKTIPNVHYYLLISLLRITAALKKDNITNHSNISSLSLMGLGVLMICLCLNLIFVP